MQSNQIRTTVYLDEDLYLAAKKKAVEERTSLKGLIQKGLKSELKKTNKIEKKRRKLKLPSFDLGLGKSTNTFRREDIYDDIKF